jgi:hypothetical protein
MALTDTAVRADDAGARDPLEAAAQALSVALDVDWADRPSSFMAESVSQVAGLAAQLMALEGAVVGAYDASGEWSADGHRSPPIGVRHETGSSAATARREVGRARKLRHLDALSDALAAGEVSTDAAGTILRADRPEVHDQLVDDLKLLLEHAVTLEHADFERVMTRWDQLADPARADRDAVDRDEKRSAHVSTVGDQVRVDAWMNQEGAAAWRAEFERREKVLFDADWAEARERLGDKATKHDLVRTPAQRRHDAMVEMANRSAAYQGDSPAPKPRVVLNLHMDYATFIAELARHTGGDAQFPGFADRLCELDDGTALVPSEALNLALGGEVRRIVFGADGHVLAYGRSRRLFTGALADAIRARDRRCCHPGCQLPAAKCEIDHVSEFQHGGRTEEPNGETLCRYHNNWKTNHQRAWQRLRHAQADRTEHRKPPPQE